MLRYPETSWDKIKNSGKPVLVYGMGNGADKVIDELLRLEIPILGVTASDAFVRGKNFRGFTVKKLSELDFVIINSPKNGTLPYILNISIPGYRSETLLHYLEEREIYVSSGSACSKGKGSHVLNEMGLSHSIIDSALRISFSRYNDNFEIDALCDALKGAVTTLRKSK